LRGSRFYRDEVSVETEQIELDCKFTKKRKKGKRKKLIFSVNLTRVPLFTFCGAHLFVVFG
jgi:hypothetical protein